MTNSATTNYSIRLPVQQPSVIYQVWQPTSSSSLTTDYPVGFPIYQQQVFTWASNLETTNYPIEVPVQQLSVIQLGLQFSISQFGNFQLLTWAYNSAITRYTVGFQFDNHLLFTLASNSTTTNYLVTQMCFQFGTRQISRWASSIATNSWASNLVTTSFPVGFLSSWAFKSATTS